MLCRVLIIVVGVPQLLGSRWIQKMGRYIIVPGHPKQWEPENREGGYYRMRYYTTAIFGQKVILGRRSGLMNEWRDRCWRHPRTPACPRARARSE
jgi:hypothetical protein